MRKFIKCLLITTLFALLITPVTADSKRLYDDGEFFYEDEEVVVEDLLREASEEIGTEFIISTSFDSYLGTVEDMARASIEEAELSDAIVLYCNEYEEEFYILRLGEEANEALSDAEVRLMLVAITNIYRENNDDMYMCIAESFVKNGKHYYLDSSDYDRDPLLVDEADLLSDSEELELTEMLETASLEHKVDFVVYTTDVDNGQDTNMAAADYYDYHNYASDGYMLYINMDTRQLYILTTGSNIITAFSDYSIDQMTALVADNLSIGAYSNAIIEFIDCFDKFYDPLEPSFDMNLRDPLVIDKTNTLAESKIISLTTELEHKANESTYDFVAYIDDDNETSNLYGKALDIYENGYYRSNGAILYINLAQNKAEIACFGRLAIYISIPDLEPLIERYNEYLANGEYEKMIELFPDEINEAYNQKLMELREEEMRSEYLTTAGISLFLAAIITIIVGVILYKQTKSFRLQNNASDYATNNGGLFSKANITRSQDIFLYRTTSRRYAPRQSNNSSSSSGSSFGGGSSSFSGSSGVSHGGGGRGF